MLHTVYDINEWMSNSPLKVQGTNWYGDDFTATDVNQVHILVCTVSVWLARVI